MKLLCRTHEEVTYNFFLKKLFSYVYSINNLMLVFIFEKMLQLINQLPQVLKGDTAKLYGRDKKQGKVAYMVELET